MELTQGGANTSVNQPTLITISKSASLIYGFIIAYYISRSLALFSLVFDVSVFQVFSEYFKELEEESIRDNFVIIYELLDELMDFGYPQTTDSKILQE